MTNAFCSGGRCCSREILTTRIPCRSSRPSPPTGSPSVMRRLIDIIRRRKSPPNSEVRSTDPMQFPRSELNVVAPMYAVGPVWAWDTLDICNRLQLKVSPTEPYLWKIWVTNRTLESDKLPCSAPHNNDKRNKLSSCTV